MKKIESANTQTLLALLLSSVIIITPAAFGQLPTPSVIGLNATDTIAIDDSGTTSASEIELSSEPVYLEEQISLSETPINETHIQADVYGNGTINLPNSTETVNNINNGSYIISTKDGIIFGKEVWSTEDETENVTTTFYAITRSGTQQQQQPETVHPAGIIIAVVQTNSTGKLAPLDGMILAGQVEVRPNESRLVTLWEWVSGTALPTGSTTITEESPQMNTTTNTATAEEINATAAVPLS
jgi:hypothetical protein